MKSGQSFHLEAERASQRGRGRHRSSSRRQFCRPISRDWAKKSAPSTLPAPTGFMST